jgi:hypothetical protein
MIGKDIPWEEDKLYIHSGTFGRIVALTVYVKTRKNVLFVNQSSAQLSPLVP